MRGKAETPGMDGDWTKRMPFLPEGQYGWIGHRLLGSSGLLRPSRTKCMESSLRPDDIAIGFYENPITGPPGGVIV